MALGALIGGLLLAGTEYRREIEVTIDPFKGLLVGVFLISIGLGLNLERMAAHPLWLAAALAVMLSVKLALVTILSRAFGLGWHYETSRDIFEEMVSVIPSYRNLSYDNLGLTGKLYPNPDPARSDGTVVMFTDKFKTDDGLAHLVPAEWLPARELPDAEYPFVLNTGRMLEHWHTGSMTRRSYALDAIAPKALGFIHPEDAAALGLDDGDMARVSSRRGVIELETKVSHREARGNCFIPFHFREAAANLLTIDEIDPFGKIPEFKFCAVRIEKADG